jgi:homoserine dehydrogenase
LLRTSTPAIDVVSVSDSRGTVSDRRGIDLATVLERKRATATGDSPRRDLLDIARSTENDVIVDLLPTDLRGAKFSREIALAALHAGKSVVTASKGVLAQHAREVRLAALAGGGQYLGSATVCGSTPVLELMSNAFRGDKLERIEGVLNGSTNFVLDRLERGAAWDEALGDARRLGILEADPSQDLLGLDAAAKAVILANHAWGDDLTLADARVDGIVGVSPAEAVDARRQGLAIRLLARATPGDVSVAPVTLPADHPLVVEGRDNVVRLKFAEAGAITLRGPGAGGRETAAAVLSDVLRVAQGGAATRNASTKVSISASVL